MTSASVQVSRFSLIAQEHQTVVCGRCDCIEDELTLRGKTAGKASTSSKSSTADRKARLIAYLPCVNVYLPPGRILIFSFVASRNFDLFFLLIFCAHRGTTGPFMQLASSRNFMAIMLHFSHAHSAHLPGFSIVCAFLHICFSFAFSPSTSHFRSHAAPRALCSLRRLALAQCHCQSTVLSRT